jgi:uncharacterized ion transporter superfamily protein YfcC
MTKSRFRVPHTLVLLTGMIVLAYGLTFVLPQGQFERFTNEHDREQVVPDTYTLVATPEHLPWHTALTAIPRGFEAAQGIIFFIFITGGTFSVLRATGAVDAALSKMLRSLGHKPQLLILTAIMVFAAGSASIGMAEEYIPFVPVLVALCLALKLDTMTAIGTLCVGYSVGYGAAILNPFTVLIAQDVANVPTTVEMTLVRSLLLVLFIAVAFHHVWSYAKKVRANPADSLVAGIEPPAGLQPTASDHPFAAKDVLVILLLLAALALLICGLTMWHWYLVEMSALFLAVSVLLGVIGRMGPSRTATAFCVGAAELTTTALLVGFARTIEVVLDDGGIIDTIVHGISLPLQQLTPSLAAVGMFAVQSVCNFFIPSGSGQAYVTMPLMAPLADLVGVSRQVAVLAYQFGDGFSNIIVPTNAVLVGILGLANIPFDRWLRFVVPFMVKVTVLGSIALVVVVLLGLG